MNWKYDNSFRNLLKFLKEYDTIYALKVLIIYITLSITLISTFTTSHENISPFIFAQIGELPTPLDKQLDLSTLIDSGSPFYGNKSAPITIIDFSDFQCHMCKRHVDNTEPELNSTYLQTGKVAYVFKHLPIRGFDSMPAALASQCTKDQGKFWQFHDILFENQGPIDSGWASPDNIRKYASHISGLDMEQFNLCFDGKKYEKFVNEDISLSNDLGFTETPSFIIVNSDGSDPQRIEGPKPFPIFKTVIEKIETEQQNTG